MDDLFQHDGQSKATDYAERFHKVIYRTKIVLSRYWWILPLAVALGITFKSVQRFLGDPTYLSSSQMIVSGRIALPGNDVYAEERDNFFGTQIELMESDQVRARAVEHIKLTHPEVHAEFVQTEAFARYGLDSLYLFAELKRDTSIFELLGYSPHQEYTRLYLDAVMEEYINRRNEMRSKTSEKTYDAIVGQLKLLETEVDGGEDAIVDFQEKNNIVFIQEQGAAAGAYLSELKRRLAELKTESRALSALGDVDVAESLLLEQLQVEDAMAAVGARNAVVDAMGTTEDNQKFLLSRDQLELLNADLEEFSIYLQPKHPKIINLKDQIERTENQLLIQRRQAMDRIRDRVIVLKSKMQNLNEEIVIWEQSALENGRLIAEFERLQSRLGRSKAAYERNQEALRAIDTDKNLQQETVSILTDASKAYPAGKGLVVRYAQGALYGMVLACGLLFVIGSLDNRILSANDLSAQFSEQLLGAIPFEEQNAGDESAVLLRRNDDRYVFAEACRNLRTSVFFMGDEKLKPSVFAITSAVPAEGKSTVSANLAVALSFSHSRVLLVDADLRRGRLHQLFKLNRSNGLSDILDGQSELENAVQSTSYDHLDFISIGSYPDHPSELLMSDRMDTFIAQAKEKYDFVIFDTAPILATDDTTNFAGKVDSVLFTIRCAYTQIRQIKPAMARLHDRKIKIDGLILNYIDVSQPGYYYYQYSEYYTDPKRNSEITQTA
jgi:capsular exopolysaccharide synthesis family protein